MKERWEKALGSPEGLWHRMSFYKILFHLPNASVYMKPVKDLLPHLNRDGITRQKQFQNPCLSCVI